ncbi:MAG: Cell division protein ftsA [Candidatus Nomurabacteria bacterium GW2011_GWE1_35_16]|uniref:Cell division protein FtsA n=1 Tax=Candidatus Nomurabacteria bacterium GW2011_GWE1_35_16 TaxID=1618761 RepID=A0A0G0BQP8_9BACT|nr:MAG: Cell division protein ftsA [Candidatus Nomurabacteria bacterium GW2011_GWE1_35_16]
MMTKNNFNVGIDIGTHTIKVVVTGINKDNGSPCVLATGTSETVGMRLGYIVNIDLVAESLKKAIKLAEATLGSKIRKACVSIGGISLGSMISTGSVIISRADQEITELDVSKVLAISEENLDIINKKIIHIIPIAYKLDGKDIHGRPQGMHGIKLEVKTLFITCLKQNLDDLITVLGLANIEVSDVLASPVALSTILLNSRQKTTGCALVDIGAETVSLSVFENNLLISLQVFSIGSMDITKDVALGFKIALEEAESVKLGSVIGGDFPKKKVDEIIEARLGDIFELVDNHLKRIRRSELLPAGIVITGGGAHITKIEEIAKKQLNLPAKVGPVDTTINNKFKIKDASWYVAYGLALNSSSEGNNNMQSSIGDNVKQVKGFFKSILSQLLP